MLYLCFERVMAACQLASSFALKCFRAGVELALFGCAYACLDGTTYLWVWVGMPVSAHWLVFFGYIGMGNV